MSNLFTKITDIENFEEAYKQTIQGKSKYKKEALIFNQNAVYNLEKLRQRVIKGKYKFSGYTRFTVYEPKERVIDAPGFKDKIVQIAINNVLKGVYYPCFIYSSYACIDNKGTHRCVDRIQYYIRKAKWQYGEKAFFINLDIKKFFYSIDRKILKNLLTKKIKCDKTLNLLYEIIDSADAISPKGMPLGNTLSQICANIYMNELDQYSKRKLSLKYYVRYADDVVIIVKNREKAKEIKNKLIQFINKKLNLKPNKRKTQIFPINQGINTVGFKIHATHRLLRNKSKKKIKRKCKKMRKLIIDGDMTKEKAEQILNSWKGHADHANSYNFIQSLLEKNDYITMNDDNVFKIDIKIINKER
ncbi:MAG: reverse transcriptase domain-containing protein [bacterium]